MDTNALDWWNLNKHIIFELVKREIKTTRGHIIIKKINIGDI